MSKKKILVALTTGIVAIALAAGGCGNKEAKQAAEKETFTAALPADTTGTITVAGHYSNFESLEAEFVRFNEIYPNIELNYVYLDSYNDTIIPAVSSAAPPDIFYLPLWMVDKEKYEVLFEAAEDLDGEELNIGLDCIRPGLIYRDANGAVPMVPVFASTFGMLVNDDLFQKEGLAVPQSYSEMIQVCDTLKERGYQNPVLSYNDSSHMLYAMIYPYFCARAAQEPEQLAKLNALDPGAGEMLRSSLELTEDFMSRGFIDTESCREMKSAYEPMILRFFEGDIPMMFVDGDTVSGTGKRESMSESFSAQPFTYSFHPIPSTEEGGYFLDSASVSLTVNKNSQSLPLANEFMRFLIRTPELGNMAKLKRLMTPATDMSLDGVYASFGEMKEDQRVYREDLGLLDAPVIETRVASWAVANGMLSVDEAVGEFGHLKEKYLNQ